MRHTISTTDLINAVGEIVNTVRLRGDCYLVSQRARKRRRSFPARSLRATRRAGNTLLRSRAKSPRQVT